MIHYPSFRLYGHSVYMWVPQFMVITLCKWNILDGSLYYEWILKRCSLRKGNAWSDSQHIHNWIYYPSYNKMKLRFHIFSNEPICLCFLLKNRFLPALFETFKKNILHPTFKDKFIEYYIEGDKIYPHLVEIRKFFNLSWAYEH